MMWHRSTRTKKHEGVTTKAKDDGSLWKKDAVGQLKLKPEQQRWRNVDAVLAASLLIIWLISSTIDKSAHTQGIRGLQYNDDDGDYTTSENTNINIHDDSSKTNNDEYVLWSRNQTYFGDCQNNIVGNDEWGEERAPYVDKVGVKDMIRKWE